MSRWRLLTGEAERLLPGLDADSFDAIITDPPYSSGGFSRDDKLSDPDAKYSQSTSLGKYPSFSGDSRDQRSYLVWSSLWINECLRVLKPGGYFLVFADWRQLPLVTDAVQCGGVFWRGIIVWDKGLGSRAPHKGYFRHQCEYIVWGTKGPIAKATHDGPFPGCVSVTVRPSDKHHLTGKPTALMRELVRAVPPGGRVLDPFAGSGTTGVAAVLAGLEFVGIEREAPYVKIAGDRLAAAEAEWLASSVEGLI